jgi:hypothetical protein
MGFRAARADMLKARKHFETLYTSRHISRTPPMVKTGKLGSFDV